MCIALHPAKTNDIVPLKSQMWCRGNSSTVKEQKVKYPWLKMKRIPQL
jgi:hypothetical protein